ncbi:MAG: exodeoxyribonuclease VII small subunit [Actinobacteria bacterium]|jgi:exodeoxyribonuclease VII small subunit|nr:exodeoxyribonuclease VII small subunit [Actinomycetota bacterium]NBO34600.1 exodeoxyribonuclease VII small subunit [Actinomycetota bacterium]
MAKDQSSEMTYEAAKSALDDVVARLENKDLPLDDMVTLWEQGEKLAAICEERLAGAKARLEALRPNQSDED